MDSVDNKFPYSDDNKFPYLFLLDNLDFLVDSQHCCILPGDLLRTGPEFHIAGGCRVEIFGIPDSNLLNYLNGLNGLVSDWDCSTGEWLVLIFFNDDKEELYSIRHENLAFVAVPNPKYTRCSLQCYDREITIT